MGLRWLRDRCKGKIGQSHTTVTHKLLLVLDATAELLLEETDLSGVAGRHRMAHSAPRFVRLRTSDHYLGGIVGCGFTLNEPLIAAGGASAKDADRVELVDHLGDRHQLGHGAERLTAKVGVGAGDDDASAPTRQ
jgi:hypothetical protein